MERAAVHALRVGVIDQRRLAGLLVDAVGCDGVFAPDEDGLALKLRRGVGAIDAVHDVTMRMHVHGARGLPGADVMGPRQRLGPEPRRWRQRVAVEREHVQLVLALE